MQSAARGPLVLAIVVVTAAIAGGPVLAAPEVTDTGGPDSGAGSESVVDRTTASAADLQGTSDPPNVTITSREDFPAEGDGEVSRQIAGRVSGVDADATATVTVDGSRSFTTELYPSRSADTATFSFSVTTDGQPTTVEVRVRASAGTDSDRVSFDGDGLPDTDERRVTGTDPLDPDSDSRETRPNEAGDGTIDGAEDLDGDSEITFRELRHGTNPLVRDTDRDGLGDGYEGLLRGADPLVADTDGDGVPDGAEDPDEDGLTNAEEERLGSSPSMADGDGDGLDDPRERELGTDPLSWDTDADGLVDGRELEDAFGTDPLDPDTDGDGVADGEERYAIPIDRPALDVSVTVTGTGDVARDVSVEENGLVYLDNDGTHAARLSPMVDVVSDRSFDRMEIAFEYDPSGVGDPADVAVWRWDPDVGTFLRLESTVYPNDHRVVATTRTVGTYVAFNTSTWVALFAEPLPPKYSERITDFDEENVTCEGSGECGVVDGALVVGEPDRSDEDDAPRERATRTPTETVTPPKSRVVWNDEPETTEGPDDGKASAGTVTPGEREAGGSFVEWIDGVVSWIDSWFPG